MYNKIGKWVLALAFIAIGVLGVNAQNATTNSTAESSFALLETKRSEVKLNLLSAALLFRPEVSYDYTINSDLAVGVRLSGEMIRNRDYTDLPTVNILPYLRWHFYRSTQHGGLRGFFAEFNLAYSYYRPDMYNLNNKPIGGGSAPGIGIGLGYKWITPKAWVFEIGGAVGRNLVASGHDLERPYGSCIFSIGKRF